MSGIYSLQLEKYVLGGLIKNPDVFYEIERFVDKNDFTNSLNSTIFTIVKQFIGDGKELDGVLIANEIKISEFSYADDIDSLQGYLDSLTLAAPNFKGTMEAAQKLKLHTIRRTIYSTGTDIQEFAKSSGGLVASELVDSYDALCAQRTLEYFSDDEPFDIFADIVDEILERAKNPVEYTGYETPYKNFNDYYGGLQKGGLYIIASRSGCGKSTFLLNTAIKMSQLNDAKVLYLDTEDTKMNQQLRIAASISGIELDDLDTGQFYNNKESFSKFKDFEGKVENFKDKIKFRQVGEKNVDEVASIIRRWYKKDVGRGNPGLVIYDYIKLTGEKMSDNWKEYQAIGEKTDKIKRLALELEIPIFTAMQQNKAGINRAGTASIDDANSISLSDRCIWISDGVWIFRPKTQDEIALYGEQFGSHVLVPVKVRKQGKRAAGFHDLVRLRIDQNTTKVINNFINVHIHNFNVEERGTAWDIKRSLDEAEGIEDSNPDDGRLL